MPTDTEKRKRARRKPFSTQSELTLDAGGFAFKVKPVDLSSSGLRIELGNPLVLGAAFEVRGEIENLVGRHKLDSACTVRWCTEVSPGRFLAGLALETLPPETPAPPQPEADFVDHYEILQLSRNADFDTIRRVFHVMAQRYHPDNKDTGNQQLFLEVVQANDVLSDPQRRASFDVQLAMADKDRVKIFDSWQSTRGVEAEIRKRNGILRLLYAQRMGEPAKPALWARELEDVLGVPREQLEFSFWFLKENKLILRADNNKFEITALGVATFEAQETTARPEPLRSPYPLLPAAS